MRPLDGLHRLINISNASAIDACLVNNCAIQKLLLPSAGFKQGSYYCWADLGKLYRIAITGGHPFPNPFLGS